MAGLAAALAELRGIAKTAVRHGFKIATHNVYSTKASDCVTELRSAFLLLKSEFPEDHFPKAAEQLAAIEDPISRIEQGLLLPPRELLQLIEKTLHRVRSDLRVAITSCGNHRSGDGEFITSEILLSGVYRKVLIEANECFVRNCPNACAAMLRRLVESLIIEAFEGHGLEANIKNAEGEYLELKALIGKAIAEPELKLTRNTRNALPNLKFLGDLSVHARRNLVRPRDLSGVRNDARCAIE